MPTDPHIATRSRKVATALRRLREELGMSCTDVADRLGVPVSEISRMETGNARLRIEDVADLLGLYDVPMTEREELLGMIRRSNETHWWERQSALPKRWRMVFGLQAEAVRIREFALLMLPGLVQTPEYGHAVLDATRMFYNDEDIDDLVSLRIASQAVLTRPDGPALELIVPEHVLRASIGGDEAMNRQRRHLLTLAERDNITVRVLPLSAGAHAGLDGAFTLFEFDDGSTILHQDHPMRALYFELAEDIALHERKWDLIGERCLSTGDSVEFLRREAGLT